MVEIAKALAFDAGIVIMDEPTSALSDAETRRLFQIIRALKAEGRAIIYISHRLEEVAEIGDRVTVLRDGRKVGSADVASRRRRRLRTRLDRRGRERRHQRVRRRGQPVRLARGRAVAGARAPVIVVGSPCTWTPWALR